MENRKNKQNNKQDNKQDMPTWRGMKMAPMNKEPLGKSQISMEATMQLDQHLRERVWSRSPSICTWDLEYMTTLVQRGADIFYPPIAREILLHRAVDFCHVGLIGALLKVGADANQPDVNNMTPLMLAAFIGQRDLIRMLLSAGASPYIRDNRNDTALDYALRGEDGHAYCEILAKNS